MNIAVYARISTKDKGQEAENQLRQLRDFISKRDGWSLSAEFVDQASAKDTNRPEFKRMLDCASRREFDVLLFWSLDRLSREGTIKTHQLLERLNGYGIEWKSFTEQYLDTCGIFKEVIISLLAVLAKQERQRLQERVKAGMERYKEDYQAGRVGKVKMSLSGKNLPIGRQKRIFDREKVIQLDRDGFSIRQIAREVGVSIGTVHKTISIQQ
jgi:DNA invertase Pin-like site-specific DNA recombinase